jgi:tail tube protein
MSFATAAFVGAGQTFEVNGAYILTRITDVAYSGSKVDVADTTDTSVGQLGYKTFIGGLQEAGEVTVKGIWYPGDASQEYIKTQLGTTSTFLHALPNSLGTVSFSGLIVGFDHSAPMDKAGEYTLKVKISGATTYAHS